MSYKITVSKKDKSLTGAITLEGSKSISNRVLVINALLQQSAPIHNLSPSDDTQVLQDALSNPSDRIDVGHAGTSFRFLTALLSLSDKPCLLTGSPRMLERPIGPLVDSLRKLGAEITYAGKEGYPPLSINGMKQHLTRDISIPGNISSQYISALLLIAPRLSKGLRLEITSDLVSKPYMQLTLDIMSFFGIQYTWADEVIDIAPQEYSPREFTVEADWSAASYYFAMAALSDSCHLQLNGLFNNSAQGDAVMVDIAQSFGIETQFTEEGILITKNPSDPPPMFENNFITHPDIAQSVSVFCAGLGTQGLFSGLETLKIKETDRIKALQNELQKFDVYLNALPVQKFSKNSMEQFYLQEGKAKGPSESTIATYKDHRMAMSFATLGMLFPITIEDAEVVNKSYPNFWKHLEQIGFTIEKVVS